MSQPAFPGLRPVERGVFYRTLKGARDLLSESVARLLYRAPAAERAFAASGAAARRIPLVKSVHRKAVDVYLEKLVADGRQHRKVSLCGVELTVDISEFTTKCYYFFSSLYEPQTTHFFLSRLKEGASFVDVGANHGYYVLLAASRVGPGGKVFAFEPNPDVMSQLRRHITLNGFGDTVTAFDLALSDASGEQVDFFLSNCATNSGLSSLVLYENAQEWGHLSPERKISVRTKTFDEWREEAGLGRIDLVKIDVEGAEAQVLRGMSKTLAVAPPRNIICETRLDSPAHAALLAHGYRATPLEVHDGSWGNILYVHGGDGHAL